MISTINLLKRWIDQCDALCIGAGSGLSTAAGFEYGGSNFLRHFRYMNERYGYTDMYSAGFHPFESLEEKWAYWSKYIYLNRYKDGAKPLYLKLLQLVKDKNYFVITTNVDHQFQLAGFDKQRLFYMQGDYGLFQCSAACHIKTYDNQEMVMNMMSRTVNHKIPTELIPLCPVCHRPMETNLRADDLFVEDEGWHRAKENYQRFIETYKDKKILFLEMGVGQSTPVWIKYPFMKMTYENADAKYVVLNSQASYIPEEIKRQTYVIQDDINLVVEQLLKE